MKKSKSLDVLVILLMLIGIFTLIFSRILAKPVSNLDELWNYNTARQIMNGLIPYKDISMITTPLLPTVVAIILKLTTDELIVFRIITALVSTAIIYMTYLIFKQLIKNKANSLILSGIILYLYYKNFMLDYNFVVLLIMLVIEYLELKKLDRTAIVNSKNEVITNENIIIGILAGLAICTKQTVGVFVAIGTLITQLLLVNNKENFKQYMKNALVRICGILIPVIIFLGFLIVSGSLKYFIEYAILGIKTFSNSIPYIRLIEEGDTVLKTLAIILPVSLMLILVALIISSISKKKERLIYIVGKLDIMTVYSIVMLIVLYPISDKTHFFIAMLPILIESLYVIFEILKKIYNKLKFKIMKYIKCVVEFQIILVMVAIGIRYSYTELSKYINAQNRNTKLEHFKNIVVSEFSSNKINAINNLMESVKKDGIDIIILDAEAASITIPLNTYHKNYDMFLKGNIGKNGEQGIIDDIQNSTKCIYLTKKNKKNLNWQTPKEVINYVEENLEKIGEVNIFNMYYKK